MKKAEIVAELEKLGVPSSTGSVSELKKMLVSERESQNLPPLLEVCTVADLKRMCAAQDVDVSKCRKKDDYFGALMAAGGGGDDDDDDDDDDSESDSHAPRPSYSSLRVADLKRILKERSLSTTGRKADLIRRLEEDDSASVVDDDEGSVAMEDAPPPPSPPPSSPPPTNKRKRVRGPRSLRSKKRSKSATIELTPEKKTTISHALAAIRAASPSASPLERGASTAADLRDEAQRLALEVSRTEEELRKETESRLAEEEARDAARARADRLREETDRLRELEFERRLETERILSKAREEALQAENAKILREMEVADLERRAAEARAEIEKARIAKEQAEQAELRMREEEERLNDLALNNSALSHVSHRKEILDLASLLDRSAKRGISLEEFKKVDEAMRSFVRGGEESILSASRMLDASMASARSARSVRSRRSVVRRPPRRSNVSFASASAPPRYGHEWSRRTPTAAAIAPTDRPSEYNDNKPTPTAERIMSTIKSTGKRVGFRLNSSQRTPSAALSAKIVEDDSFAF